MPAYAEHAVVLAVNEQVDWIRVQFDRVSTVEQAVDIRSSGEGLVLSCSLDELAEFVTMLAEFVEHHRPAGGDE